MVKAKGSLRPLLLLLKLLLLLVLLSCYLEPGWVTASVSGSSPPRRCRSTHRRRRIASPRRATGSHTRRANTIVLGVAGHMCNGWRSFRCPESGSHARALSSVVKSERGHTSSRAGEVRFYLRHTHAICTAVHLAPRSDHTFFMHAKVHHARSDRSYVLATEGSSARDRLFTWVCLQH